MRHVRPDTVIETVASWTGLLGAVRQLAAIEGPAEQPAAAALLRRLGRFQGLLREHAGQLAPALVVDDGIAQVASKPAVASRTDRAGTVSHRFVKGCALLHYAIAAEDRRLGHAGAITTVCRGSGLLAGAEPPGSAPAADPRATRPMTAQIAQAPDAWGGDEHRLGLAHLLALAPFQMNTAFSKVWLAQSDRRVTDHRARFLVERDVLIDALGPGDLVKLTDDAGASFQLPEDEAAAMLSRSVSGDSWDIRRCPPPDDDEIEIETKAGTVSLVPCQVRLYRSHKMTLRAWDAIGGARAAAGGDTDAADRSSDWL